MEKKKWPALALRVFAKCAAMGRAPATGVAYWNWFEKYLRFHRKPPKWEWIRPEAMGRFEIEQFLTHLAAKERVSPSTQNQAFSGLLFIYHNVLGIKIENVNALRAYQPKYIPEVLSANELTAVLSELNGRNLLIAYLCAGAGLRIGEVFALRIKDIRFDLGRIHIRQAKGHKDRIVQLPAPSRCRCCDSRSSMSGDCMPLTSEMARPVCRFRLGWNASIRGKPHNCTGIGCSVRTSGAKTRRPAESVAGIATRRLSLDRWLRLLVPLVFPSI